MQPDAADTTPTGRQPNRPQKEIESAPLYAHSQIDSIVLNAAVADVYAYCFEELPRFITSLRDVQKIDENTFLVHFSAGRQRIQDRFTDRAPYSGATNCMAS